LKVITLATLPIGGGSLGKERTFVGWDESKTGQFGQRELLRLRDEHPSVLAESLWAPGAFVQGVVVKELLAHGNPQKAALVCRELVGARPVTETTLRDAVGDKVVDFLLQADVRVLPRTPDEYK
jgi:hypothetical protein